MLLILDNLLKASLNLLVMHQVTKTDADVAALDARRDEPCRGWQTLDEDVKERLGLAVDPVQVLEDQEQRLLVCFA